MFNPKISNCQQDFALIQISCSTTRVEHSPIGLSKDLFEKICLRFSFQVEEETFVPAGGRPVKVLMRQNLSLLNPIYGSAFPCTGWTYLFYICCSIAAVFKTQICINSIKFGSTEWSLSVWKFLASIFLSTTASSTFPLIRNRKELLWSNVRCRENFDEIKLVFDWI